MKLSSYMPFLFRVQGQLLLLQCLTEVGCFVEDHQLGGLVRLGELRDADLQAVKGPLEVDPPLPLHGVVQVPDVLHLVRLLHIFDLETERYKTCLNSTKGNCSLQILQIIPQTLA